ncbi:MAG: type II toxin-antitoxin system RelE/ParE family toxin [bacterium]|nr:type II toxin-antitoxin system RelE/ParE family toxin [bacterium]
MSWEADFDSRATRALEAFSADLRLRVLKRVDWLVQNFDSAQHIELKEEWRGYYKLRVGDYRIAYRIDYAAHMVRVDYIDRRDKVYKRKGRK